MSKIDVGLQEAMAGAPAGARFDVILTVREGATPEALERAGLRISHAADYAPIVSGSGDAAAIRALAALDAVELIEPDGEVRAI